MKTLVGAVVVVVAILGIIALFSMDRTPTTGKVIYENQSDLPVQNTAKDPIIPAGGSEYEVKIVNYAYSPNVIEIPVGSKVIWENRDSVGHTVTSDDGDYMNSALMMKGEKYEYVFDTAGTYSYFCEPHPYMKGKVIVK